MSGPARVKAGRALESVFEITKREGRAALIPYFCAGDPDLDVTRKVLVALVEAGADVIELGVPFSDPVADGPAIQAASERALLAGTHTNAVLEIVEEFAGRYGVPVILFGYYNPICQMGEAAFASQLGQSGAAGALVVDLSFEESHGLRDVMAAESTHLISLIAPTTPLDRAAEIAEAASGFLYYVSMTGVTGRSLQGVETVRTRVAALHERTSLPVAVGFGVRTPSDVAGLARFADGVVVGSELVRRILIAGPEDAPAVAKDFVGRLREATKR